MFKTKNTSKQQNNSKNVQNLLTTFFFFCLLVATSNLMKSTAFRMAVSLDILKIINSLEVGKHRDVKKYLIVGTGKIKLRKGQLLGNINACYNKSLFKKKI